MARKIEVDLEGKKSSVVFLAPMKEGLQKGEFMIPRG